jgi:cell wall-associated NlpC family hydrolase
VERLPTGRHIGKRSRGNHARLRSYRALRPARAPGRVTMLAAAVTLASLALPAVAATAAPATTPSSLKALLARASKLSNEIDSLSQQYDGLKIQLTEARAEVRIAQEAATRDARQLTAGQAAVGQIAAQGYMTGSFDPALQLLQSSNPQSFIDRASIMLQLQQENGDKVTVLAAAEAAAQRARLTAQQEARKAAVLAVEMNSKVQAIQRKENVLNGAAFTKAMAIFRQTGQYPNFKIPGNSIGVQALRWALTRRGDPYVWGGAGPSDFDCSGLVMWAYAQVGISLPHFTGFQWNSGVHVSRSQLQPGDLVFFFPDISHVGMYVGNGLMLDAPTFGQPVQVQPIFWSAYVGAVRIVG